MPSILDKIVATKRSEIAAAKAAVPEAELRRRIDEAPPPRDFFQALSGSRPDQTDCRGKEGQSLERG